MTLEQAQRAFAALAPGGQARFLALLAHDTTVWARSSYPELLEDSRLVMERLRACNELQHRVTAQLAHLLEQDPRRYPDDVLVAILFEMGRPAGCEGQLTQTFQDLHAAYLRRAEGTDETEGKRAPVSTTT
jgi:ketosteroid isomerase-like protein